jgi:hypothetical protein
MRRFEVQGYRGYGRYDHVIFARGGMGRICDRQHESEHWFMD